MEVAATEVRAAVAAGEARIDDVERRADGLEQGLERVDDLASASERHDQELAALADRVTTLRQELVEARAKTKVLEGRLALRELREETTWAWPRPRAEAPATELPPPDAR
jgi:predicted RNase H-like nuclease (RuvC/YqgF family)